MNLDGKVPRRINELNKNGEERETGSPFSDIFTISIKISVYLVIIT